MDGYNPLHNACRFGHLKIAEILISNQRININAQDHQGRTPLHLASQSGKAQIVEALLKSSNIDVHLTDNDQNSCLHLACNSGYAKVVEVLLQDRRIDVNAKNNEGYTPLHLACYLGQKEVVKTLLQDPRVDVNALGKDQTALEWIERKGHREIVAMIKDFCARDSMADVIAIRAQAALVTTYLQGQDTRWGFKGYDTIAERLNAAANTLEEKIQKGEKVDFAAFKKSMGVVAARRVKTPFDTMNLLDFGASVAALAAKGDLSQTTYADRHEGVISVRPQAIMVAAQDAILGKLAQETQGQTKGGGRRSH